VDPRKAAVFGDDIGHWIDDGRFRQPKKPRAPVTSDSFVCPSREPVRYTGGVPAAAGDGMVAAIARDFGGLRIDTTDWPIVLMEFPEQRLSDNDFHNALLYVEQLWLECERMGLKSYQVVDFTRMREIAPASQRRHAADWVSRTETLVKRVSLGGACVTPSSILRGLVTAIMWLHKPPNPTEFFATRPQAYLHGIGQLEQARVPLPARIAELRARLADSVSARPSSWAR
jgi:hypothetical protein